MSVFVLISAGALLVIAGVGIGYWLGTIGRKHEADKASDLQKELDDYRQNVTAHFNVTADKFQAIGKEYRKLYEHMASGAAELCHPEQSGERLEFPSAELIGKEEPTVEPEAQAVVDSPPVDFEVTEPEVRPDAEIATLDEVSSSAEPTDEDLLETESSEELLAEHERAQDAVDPGKTYH